MSDPVKNESETGENAEDASAAADKVALSVATGFVILRHRKYRRNLLFGLTAFVMFLVFGGMVFLGDALMKRPIAFVVFWGFVFVLVMTILFLAVYDLLAIRREGRARMDALDLQLAAAAEEARELAEQEKAKLADAEESDRKTS